MPQLGKVAGASWSTLTQVPMCSAGRKPRRTKVSEALMPMPILSPSRSGAWLLSTLSAADDTMNCAGTAAKIFVKAPVLDKIKRIIILVQ